jgi:hypothetical protein
MKKFSRRPKNFFPPHDVVDVDDVDTSVIYIYKQRVHDQNRRWGLTRTRDLESVQKILDRDEKFSDAIKKFLWQRHKKIMTRWKKFSTRPKKFLWQRHKKLWHDEKFSDAIKKFLWQRHKKFLWRDEKFSDVIKKFFPRGKNIFDPS